MSSWNSPNRVLYGTGSAKTVGQQLVKFGCKKVIVVYDKGIEAAGIVAKILGYIEEAGIETVKYGGCLSDAPDYTINEAGALARSENVDGVVAVGGGSSLDTGKGVCILLSNDPPIPQYFAAFNRKEAGEIASLAEKFGKASDCVECGQCEAMCPQLLPIRNWLKTVAEKYEA